MQSRFERPRFSGERFGDRRGGGFRGGRGRDDFPKPVKEGEEYDVEIAEVGTKGDGIARVKNFVIFVPNVRQGEKCRIKIKTVRPKFAFAEKLGESKDEVKEEKVEREENFEELQEDIEGFDEDIGDEEFDENK